MLEIIYTLVVTHITIICVTLFLHRGQAHRAIIFNPILSHFMRFWLWLTTGMNTKEWVGIHRMHHHRSDKPGDPHSPHVYGILRVLFGGVQLYHQASKDKDMVEQFSKGSPDDWIENKIYTPYTWVGVVIMLIINTLLFGWLGLLIWVIQMIWIPFWAAGVINGLGHWVGYKNGETKDNSHNISPWGIVIGGEELHNNHHLAPASARLSKNWYEFDIGWMWFKIFETLKLARLK